jgi:hypothetical protein
MIYDDLFDEIGVKRYTNYFSARCQYPDHEDSSPSMLVYADVDKPDGLGRFYCSGCNRGNTHTYLLHLIGKSGYARKPEHNQQIFQPMWRTWQQQYSSISELAQSAHNIMKVLPSRSRAAYFKQRALLPVVDQCVLGMKEAWATFPIFDQSGKIIDIIVRNTLKVGESKYIIHPNDESTPLLYVPNWKRVLQSDVVYIVYGIVDALALEMCGLPVVTGSTGKSLSNKRLIALNKRWCIIPDRREEEAAYKLAKGLGNFTEVRLIPYQSDEKDPDDVRMKRGLDTLKSLILER